jgi:hypothetical protein
MSESTTQRNKAFVLEAFETLFNKKGFVAAEKFWSQRPCTTGARFWLFFKPLLSDS